VLLAPSAARHCSRENPGWLIYAVSGNFAVCLNNDRLVYMGNFSFTSVFSRRHQYCSMSQCNIKRATHGKGFMPVEHVLLPLHDNHVRQISVKVEDRSTRSGKICTIEKHTEHEALNDGCHCEHREKYEQKKAVSVLHHTTTLQHRTQPTGHDGESEVKASSTRYRALGPKLIQCTHSPQVIISHPPGGRLPLLFARPVVTFPTTQHHRPLAGTKLYCLVTEAHRCEQLA